MAGFLRFVVYYDLELFVLVGGLDISLDYLFYYSLIFFVRRGENILVVYFNFFILLLFLPFLGVPAVKYFLGQVLYVFLTESIIHEYLGGAFYFFVDLFPGAAVRQCPPDVGADGGVFISLWAFAPSVEAASWVSRLCMDLCAEVVSILFNEYVQERECFICAGLNCEVKARHFL